MNQTVSVIMPCYNDGAYIEESIDSVWKQTYRQVELIVVDDGSDDPHTQDVLRKLSEDKRCSVITVAHGGPSKARNKGIRQAKGQYILPLDSDDIIDPTYIEKAVCALAEKQERGVVYCQAKLFGGQSGRWQLPDYSFRQMLRDNIVFVTSLFYKEDWQRVGGFNENMTDGMEDYDFFLSILEAGKEIYQIPEVLFSYRIKNKSRTSNLSGDMTKLKQMYRQIYDNHPRFYAEYRDQYAKELRDCLIELICERNANYAELQNYRKMAGWTSVRVIRRLHLWMDRLKKRV